MQALEHVGRYNSSAACAVSIVQKEGWLSLYQGFGATCGRNCSFNGAYFGGIFAIKDAFPVLSTLEGGASGVLVNLGVAMAAAMGATLVKMPFDGTFSF
jgi:hypothetical protein